MDDLEAYAGLVLDGFLLPQVIRNSLSGSKVRALSPWFYASVAAIRTAPHAYDAFRMRSYVPSLRPSLAYAGPPRRPLRRWVGRGRAVWGGAARRAALLAAAARGRVLVRIKEPDTCLTTGKGPGTPRVLGEAGAQPKQPGLRTSRGVRTPAEVPDPSWGPGPPV